MTSLKVGDLVELRAGSGTVGTVLDVVENRPRWILVDWHTPPDTLAAGDGRDSQRRGRTACHCE